MTIVLWLMDLLGCLIDKLKEKGNVKMKTNEMTEQEKLERLMKIEGQLRNWGLDRLTPEGVKKWTEDVQWLMEQALNAHQYRIAIEGIARNIDDKENLLWYVEKALQKK